ncbi:MAG: ATP-binding protein [Verrucomicrobiales bacterium]
MKLKPWYDVVKPREDLREGKSQDASEFAVHLDRVRDGTGRRDYADPEQFFAKTFLAANLLDLASQVVRRMAGETSHTSPVFNLATNFGGGKTHALTLLYHLANNGPKSHGWLGVRQIRDKAAVAGVPKGKVAVFVGTEFDSLTGRGGEGEPRRKTPWGEIAWQLGGSAAFELVKEHDAKRIAPGGDVLRKIVPENEPCLILMDELMNYMSRFRREGLSDQFYGFLMNLSGAINPKSVLVVSVPASIDLEMTPDDVADYARITKMLDRVGKAMIMTAGAETNEIVRRRLFDWDTRALGADGKVALPEKGRDACHEYARWVADHAQQLPGSIPPEHARAYFEASYPFHPSVLGVFERKWQSVPKFQQTRGVLRMLAIWVSQAYNAAYRKAHPDALLTLGTAPFADPIFRAAVFEQLGNRALETAVTTDIAGRKDSHASILDKEASDAVRSERLHQKVATVVFFESNGGAARAEATVPEIRLAVGHPDLDLGNIETALDALVDKSYYLIVEKKNYKFSLKENLNKRFADKRANVKAPQVEEQVKQEIQKQFIARDGLDRVFFPEKSIQISDRPMITLIIGDLNHTMEDASATLQWVEAMTKECGSQGRTFKSALIWVIADAPGVMFEEARKVLAWQAIDDETEELKFDEPQKRQLAENLQKARRDLKESVWRSFRYIFLLSKDNSMRQVDLGLVHSSSATGGPIENILNHLMTDGDFDKGVSVRLLLKNWSGAFTEWPTKSVRDALYASPQFPRILKGAAAIQETIAKGVTAGEIAYVGKTTSGKYSPFIFGSSLSASDVEISEDVFLIRQETAEGYLKAQPSTPPVPTPPDGGVIGAGTTLTPIPPHLQPELFPQIQWTGEIPPQKWMNFYTKVLSKFASAQGLKLTLKVEAKPEGGVSKQKLDETKSALRELGLNDDVSAR